MKRKYKVFVLFDFPLTPPDQQYEKYVDAQDWRPNRNVIEALEKSGHQVHTFALFDKLDPLIEELKSVKPDIVFNLAESFANDRRHESSLVGLLELMNIPYTGNSSLVLSICTNKFYTKRLLAHKKIKMPKSVVFPMGNLKKNLKNLTFPVFVKPLGQEGSDGIAQSSFAEDVDSCITRVQFLHDSLKCDALVEEYIEGREIYSGIIGNQRLKVLPTREMIFANMPEDRPKFATFKAKWDKDFRKKWGIKNTFADALNEKTSKKIDRISRIVYKTLGLKGYGRLDLRLTTEEEIFLIEVNPNPSLSNDDEIAYAASRLGIKYPDLIHKILELGIQEHTSSKKH